MGFLTLPVFLVIVPIILAMPWTAVVTDNRQNRLLLCWPLGYFLEFALFEFLAVPFTLLRFSFSALCVVYLVVLCGACVVSILKSKPLSPFKGLKIEPYSVWEIIYAVVALALIGWQIYHAVTMDRTYMSFDDSTYVAMANDALTNDLLVSLQPYTGVFTRLPVNRALQSSLIFPAFLSWTSGISVVLMEHTILDVYYLIIGYVIYCYMGFALFKKRENALCFLCVVSTLYIFGNYSIYSQTMRFLGLNYVGKAILAVLFFPLLFAMMTEKLQKPYQRRFGVLLLLMSAAACGLTLFGAVTVVANVTLPIVFMLFGKKRDWKQLRYIPWVGMIPVLCVFIFVLYRFVV